MDKSCVTSAGHREGAVHALAITPRRITLVAPVRLLVSEKACLSRRIRRGSSLSQYELFIESSGEKTLEICHQGKNTGCNQYVLNAYLQREIRHCKYYAQ